MNILVLRGGALGDFVVTLPALASLRRRWPEARIECVGNARAARLAVGRGLLDAAHDQNDLRWSRLGADAIAALRPGEPLARWLAGFDLVVNFWPDPDGAIARDFAALGFSASGARRIVPASPQPALAPAARHFLAALEPLGLEPVEEPGVLTFRLQPTEADRAAAARRLTEHSEGWIAWHPGSGSPAKNWPVERWLATLERLRARPDFRELRLAVILGGAETERPDLAESERRLPAGAVVLRDDPPEVLAAILERCSLFLGHDTGPAHVAAAVGCPCVLVFGPTDPGVWAPPGDHVRVVRRGARTDAVTIEDVAEAIGEVLGATEAAGVQRNLHGFDDHSGPA